MSEENDTVLLDSDDAKEYDVTLRESSKMNLTLMEQEETNRNWLIRYGPVVIMGIAVIILGSYLWFW